MIFEIIDILFQVYFIMLFVRIIGSWIPELQEYRAMEFVRFYTDPYLNLFRRIIPPIGMMDISPIFAFIALGFIQQFLKYVLLMMLK